MDSLSLCFSSSSLHKPYKLTPQSPKIPSKIPISTSLNPNKPHFSTKFHHLTSKTSPIFMGFLSSSTLPSLASELSNPSSEPSQRINIESILVSIDDFFNKYPFFVAGVYFTWLVVIPIFKNLVSKCRFISAIDAFNKLRDDSSAQLLDIRDEKSLGFLCSPDLRLYNKNVVQVCFDEADVDGFLKKVGSNFVDPQNTVVCVLDNFDGNSMKVAELLFKNGFKEAYAIEGGVRGKKGWQEIQEEFLPPAVHVFRRKDKKSRRREANGAVNQTSAEQVSAAASDN
ncbi:hypothetical protein RND81_02G015100 [Saponaria officinalis]|uniref:Rhodanese domain-containing protein n=1 Tax=Saponaria officinalis TaxID=3572 RepID=A0AAW1MMH7_SAPOF